MHPQWLTTILSRPSRLGFDVKDLSELARDRTAVGVGRHELPHVSPPAAAHVGLGHGGPACLVLDLDIREKIARVRIEVNRIGLDPVLDERLLELGPNRPVAALSSASCPGCTAMRNALRSTAES